MKFIKFSSTISLRLLAGSLLKLFFALFAVGTVAGRDGSGSMPGLVEGLASEGTGTSSGCETVTGSISLSGSSTPSSKYDSDSSSRLVTVGDAEPVVAKNSNCLE